MDQQQQTPCVPPGFRFHPTEEELVGYYLARKVAAQKIDLDIIREVDLYRIEPWDLQERCSYYGGVGSGAGGQDEEPTEYYFFSYKDRKYPSGTRTNRATAAGFWKATGRDKPVLSSSRSSAAAVTIIGMRKTLVFYRGRAPNGRKTDWIIHEYRLQNNEHAPAQVRLHIYIYLLQIELNSIRLLHMHMNYAGGRMGGVPRLPEAHAQPAAETRLLRRRRLPGRLPHHAQLLLHERRRRRCSSGGASCRPPQLGSCRVQAAGAAPRRHAAAPEPSHGRRRPELRASPGLCSGVVGGRLEPAEQPAAVDAAQLPSAAGFSFLLQEQQ
ncbi:unnamed protein product [Urochloa decumbens]|uniref:NAC domain-containing protein n=1 Tax=Urochloa decumbens TaxID=240449 RepID=A0ABC9B846_9POAL